MLNVEDLFSSESELTTIEFYDVIMSGVIYNDFRWCLINETYYSIYDNNSRTRLFCVHGFITRNNGFDLTHKFIDKEEILKPLTVQLRECKLKKIKECLVQIK